MPGGVCAVLDYEVEVMADYVSEMATRIVQPQKNVNPAFRKFVSQVLSSTRLPSTTILLGMNYLAKRINMMQHEGQPNPSEGQVWRLLTVALLLGSKFLDDNTFQNKSWSEVSGIPVNDLNKLEIAWLEAFKWVLYVNLDESKDYKAWLANWQEWLETKERQQAQASRECVASLSSPIETDMRSRKYTTGSRGWHEQQVAEYERLSRLKRSQASAPAVAYSREQPWVYSGGWHAAPLTPPDSGYGTPEYLNSATSLNSQYNEWFDRALVNGTAQRAYNPTPQFNSYHHGGNAPRNYANYPAFYPYSHSIWDPANLSECGCANCSQGFHHKTQPYFVQNGYGQPVVG